MSAHSDKSTTMGDMEQRIKLPSGSAAGAETLAELSLDEEVTHSLVEKKNKDIVRKTVKNALKREEKKKRVKEDPVNDAEGNPFRKVVDWKDYPCDKYHACTGKGGCGLVKLKSSFVKDKAVKAGVRNICKLCKNKSIRNKNSPKDKTKKSVGGDE